MNYNKFNIIYLLQKWMDSVAGQTFLNYAYSWGAAVVILGTLFKLTHLPYADLMLYIGMGTEVMVFFFSAFDRPFDKTQDGLDISERQTGGATGNPVVSVGDIITPEVSKEYIAKLTELSDMLGSERNAVEKMIRQTDVCTTDMISLSENIKKIDSVASSVADALTKR